VIKGVNRTRGPPVLDRGIFFTFAEKENLFVEGRGISFWVFWLISDVWGHLPLILNIKIVPAALGRCFENFSKIDR